MKDINGNKFKVGCVYEDKTVDGELREVLKVYENGLISIQCGNPYTQVFWHDTSMTTARILHYRELAPDKNGFMLCEGDKIDTVLYKNVTIQGIAGRYLIVEYEPDEFVWVSSETITFVSRPTDMSIKSAEATKLEQLIKEAKESWHKLDEALKKAKEAGLCN